MVKCRGQCRGSRSKSSGACPLFTKNADAMVKEKGVKEEQLGKKE